MPLRHADEVILCPSGFRWPEEPGKVAVAVSGGSDSMALALLAAQHVAGIKALTVDHCLRPESGAEAKQVAAWMAACGIPHQILIWQHDGIIRGNLQQAARRARYDLLTEYCRQQGFQTLLIGHTEDDQAETVALRQERAAGPVGLAGISARTEWHGITVLRPLLGCSRDSLRRYLQQQGQGWVDDPSNDNTDYDRIRIRKTLASDPSRRAELLALGRKMGRERQHIEGAFLRFSQEFVKEGQLLTASQPPFLGLPQELAIYALSRFIIATAAREYPPRWRELQRLWEQLQEHPQGRATLGHCLIDWDRQEIRVRLEFHRMSSHITRAKPLVSTPFYCIEDL